ncbi:GNAT family N-acetyltransferase [Streptomyces marincola]|uniref:GNAT family N-acetyltransferase n=1 Tax=Streptomyces marincola TaxID=2878388 RepID=A0A1W7D0W6_9ACTN|nr:GNAT family N-acetyltransferase [Streptomyces marincola]ARQ70666.1 GNAT family N-acetyltransferase [Streptomyces marincola]
MSNELRVLTEPDWKAWLDALEWAFGGLHDAPEEQQLWRDLLDFDRSFGLWDGDRPVGTFGTLAMEVTVPGGTALAAAGVTTVSVAATHRRRGVLRSMMRRALDTYRESGEPLAILTASEPAIYGRFGFGAATQSLAADIEIHRVGLDLPAGVDDIALSVAEPAAVAGRCEELYARLARTRPGMFPRQPGWERLPLLDPPQDRAGASEQRYVLAERDGELAGYARYALKPEWEAAGAKGTVIVRDLEAADPAAYGALLRYLSGIDLMSTLSLANRPVDDAFLHMVSDVRRARTRVQDRLYLRPMDVGAALAGRTYATEVDVVLDVSDASCPWNEGRWRLSGGPKGAVCEPTADAADLALPVAALGAAYLGGTSLAALAAAGRVEELRPGALARAATAFTSPLAPWMPHGF